MFKIVTLKFVAGFLHVRVICELYFVENAGFLMEINSFTDFTN